MERVSQTVNPAIEITDCNALPETTSVNTTNLDANETKLEIYQSAATQADSAENYHTLLDNRLEDTKTVALIKGKAGYINKWNETRSESAARSAATENVTEYYSVMERNLISEWNSQVSNIDYLRQLAEEETGVPGWFTYIPTEGDEGDGIEPQIVTNMTGTGSSSVTLQNGSKVDVKTIELVINNTDTNESTAYSVGPKTGELDDVDPFGLAQKYWRPDVHRVVVGNPGPEQDQIEPIVFEEYGRKFSDIDNQTTSAADQMDTVVNQTIEGLKSRDITVSDMIDPYVLQNQFSPGSEYQGWAAANLAMLGANRPTNYSQTGAMNVTLEDGTQLQGIIMSAQSPSSGEFEVNQTYDPSAIDGTQWLTQDSSIRELKTNFTIDRITTADGETRQNFTVVKKTYETTSADDLIALNNQLAELQASIEARESAFGGGGGLGDLGGSQGVVIIAGIALVGYGLSRD
jgi:thymidylate synthase